MRRHHGAQRLVLSLPELRKHEWVLVVNGLGQPGLSGSQILDGDYGFTTSLVAMGSFPPFRSQAIDIARVDAPIVYGSQRTIASTLLANFFSPVDKCEHQRRAKQVM